MEQVLISDMIKAFRKDKHLTQVAFAKILGVSPQAVSKWERCECYPDIMFLPVLAKILDCTVNDFFTSK